MSRHSSSPEPKRRSGNRTGWRMLITIILNFLITVAEILGGIFAGSLSLISDAMHNFSDGVAVTLSYLAIQLNKKPKNFKYTFGYKRAEILVAVFNSAILIGISAFLVLEAINRLRSPEVVQGDLMILVASIGLLANIVGTMLLRPGARDNMNIRSAYLHLLSDALSSVGVVIGGIFIHLLRIYWIDPLLTIGISLYIVKESYDIVKGAVSLLMMATPPHLSIPKIEAELYNIEKIQNVHHVHLWRINENTIHFEAHVEVDDLSISETTDMMTTIEQRLREKFAITHVTIQFECGKCGEKRLV